MGLVILFVCVGAALNLALWVALYRKLDALPPRVAYVVRRERSEDAELAMTVLQEAAAAKVGPLVFGIRTYHEELQESLRAQVAEAETRARVAERRAHDAGAALATAAALVRELRATVDGLGELPAVLHELQEARAGVRTAAGGMAVRATVPDDADEDAREARKTLPSVPSASPPANAGDDSDDDRTVVATRPAIPPPRASDAAHEGTVPRGDDASAPARPRLRG